MPKFYFQVEVGSELASFQEVTGLDSETQAIEYRDGASKVFSQNKMPGLMKYGNITMKKGVFKSDNKFWDWYNQIKMNTVERVSVTIRLLGEDGTSTMAWTLTNAWPTKITGTDLKSEGNEVAVESLEIAFETMTVSAP